MEVYNITYFINDTNGCGCEDHEHEHTHNDSCGCGHNHSHDHEKTSCDCGHDHEHHHEENSCGCGHDDEHHNEGSSCGCGHNHEHHHSEEEADSEVKIIAKIRSFGAWAQIMPESFVVKSDLTAKEMYDELKSVSNAGDILLVTKIDTTDVAYSNEALLEWLSK